MRLSPPAAPYQPFSRRCTSIMWLQPDTATVIGSRNPTSLAIRSEGIEALGLFAGDVALGQPGGPPSGGAARGGAATPTAAGSQLQHRALGQKDPGGLAY